MHNQVNLHCRDFDRTMRPVLLRCLVRLLCISVDACVASYLNHQCFVSVKFGSGVIHLHRLAAHDMTHLDSLPGLCTDLEMLAAWVRFVTVAPVIDSMVSNRKIVPEHTIQIVLFRPVYSQPLLIEPLDLMSFEI